MDGVSDKWRKGERKTVRFGGVRRITKEDKDEEELEEKAVATLSLSVQVPAGDVSPGLIPRALCYIWDALRCERECSDWGSSPRTCHLSVFEVYNEEVRDLLQPPPSPPLTVQGALQPLHPRAPQT